MNDEFEGGQNSSLDKPKLRRDSEKLGEAEKDCACMGFACEFELVTLEMVINFESVSFIGRSASSIEQALSLLPICVLVAHVRNAVIFVSPDREAGHGVLREEFINMLEGPVRELSTNFSVQTGIF